MKPGKKYRTSNYFAMKWSFVVLVSCLISHVSNLAAQDIHFTQFNFSPLNQNPANTNLFDGDMRLVGNYKNQWQSVPVAYNTASASVDMNFVTLKNNDKIGGGLLFYYDRAGDSKFTSVHVAYSMSYLMTLRGGDRDDAHNISFGYQVGFVNRSFDYTKLFFDNQFNGDAFNANTPTNESFSRTGFLFLDMAAGVVYKWKADARQNLSVGVSVAHFNSPSQSFYGNNSVTLAPLFDIHLRGKIKIFPKVDILPEFLYQRQQTKQEFVPGVHFKTYLHADMYSVIALNTGVYYRIGDAASPMVGMDYNNLQVNLSYDVNHSSLTPASRYNGGLELSLIYIISKINKLSYFESCPIF